MSRRTCAQCGKSIEGKQATAKFCSPLCRVNASNGKRPTVQVSGDGPVTMATRTELTNANVLDSMLGAAALAIAKLLDTGESGGAAAQLAARLIDLRREALRDATVAVDPVDELRLRRDAKRHTG